MSSSSSYDTEEECGSGSDSGGALARSRTERLLIASALQRSVRAVERSVFDSCLLAAAAELDAEAAVALASRQIQIAERSEREQRLGAGGGGGREAVSRLAARVLGAEARAEESSSSSDEERGGGESERGAAEARRGRRGEARLLYRGGGEAALLARGVGGERRRGGEGGSGGGGRGGAAVARRSANGLNVSEEGRRRNDARGEGEEDEPARPLCAPRPPGWPAAWSSSWLRRQREAKVNDSELL